MRDWRRQLAVWLESLADWVDRVEEQPGDALALQEADMCPNCVTPWKCNGPHLSPMTPEDFTSNGEQSW